MNKKYKIGIFGSAMGIGESAVIKAKALGKALGDYKDKIIIITGATTGLPLVVSNQAIKKGVTLWGFSAAKNKDQHALIAPGDDIQSYQKLVFVPSDYAFINDTLVCRKYRNVTSTASCDAGIIISGRWGTMNEFTNLHDMGKVIGVLTGTGGIADELPKLMKKIIKKSKATVIFDSSPKHLIKKILNGLTAKKYEI